MYKSDLAFFKYVEGLCVSSNKELILVVSKGRDVGDKLTFYRKDSVSNICV